MIRTRSHRLQAAAILLALLPGAPAIAGPDGFVNPQPGEANALCVRFAHAMPPASDQPTAAQRKALAHCDGEALLYGIGRPVDPVQARLCAFVQRDDPALTSDGQSGLFNGNGLLMTIYANGSGVPRDRSVAVHLACDGVGMAEAEQESRIPHIAGTLHEPFYGKAFYGKAFSPCDDITSGFAESECARHGLRIATTARTMRLKAYAARLPAGARPGFDALRQAQARWADARGDGEVDQTGSGRGADEIAEVSLQDDDFVAMLTRLQSCHPPRLGAAQLRAAQVRLDATLAKLLAMPTHDFPGEVTPDGISEAQAAWTVYRDAWGAFATSACPGWSADGARAWVTMKRADMLERMLANLD